MGVAFFVIVLVISLFFLRIWFKLDLFLILVCLFILLFVFIWLF